jgi:CubicO group peptidase (beta-lactamase class C family)
MYLFGFSLTVIIRTFCVAVLSAMLAAPALIAQTKSATIDSLLTALHHENKISGSFLVAEAGKIIYDKGFGQSEDGRKFDGNSVYELASVSKQFTAVAIMILQERGKLGYNDPISKFIPELSFYEDVTVLHLIQHTSGINEDFLYQNLSSVGQKIITNEILIGQYQLHKPPLVTTPGTQYAYSNVGYALLASIVERISKMPFDKFMKKNIFKPLGMTQTFVNTQPFLPKHMKNYVRGYVYNGASNKYFLADQDSLSKKMIWSNAVVGPAKMCSTVRDLYKWDRALYTNKLVSRVHAQ